MTPAEVPVCYRKISSLPGGKHESARSSMKVFIRRITERDLDNLQAWSEAIGSQAYMQKVSPQSFNGADLSGWGEDYIWFVITADGRDVGSVWVERRRRDSAEGVLGIIIGDPCLLGRGIGRRAIDLATREARFIMGIDLMRLTVRMSNIRAIRAYQSCGFIVTGSGTVRLADGTPVPFYRMENCGTPY